MENKLLVCLFSKRKGNAHCFLLFFEKPLLSLFSFKDVLQLCTWIKKEKEKE